ncbi:MAG: hypothetical protein EOL87_07715 [Spartobacteria bacterium]|nr:hypothetical protein [Spartobacteria bacterium]
MHKITQRLVLPLEFPQGICAGEQSDGNSLFIARDGMKRPVLRGTALAGALRHACYQLEKQRALGDDFTAMSTDDWFGCASYQDEGTESILKVPDCLLQTSDHESYTRTHIAVSRHSGAVLDHALFTLEALPPGTWTDVCLYLETEKEDQKAATAFLRDLVSLFEQGMALGGNTARGLGYAKLRSTPLWRVFDAEHVDEQAELLDEKFAWRKGVIPNTGSPITADDEGAGYVFKLDLKLGMPEGEDLVVGDGAGLDYDLEPQRVLCADGKEHWRIPGSSLRGMLRGWMTRLAARDSRFSVADTADRYRNGTQPVGDDLAWGFSNAEDRTAIQDRLSKNAGDLSTLITCPVMRLFGSGFSKGRIHVSDAVDPVPVQPNKQQQRSHVGIDRFSGGATEGFFFQNIVLTGDSQFPLSITINEPEEYEIDWLISALRALDIGILRVGSSKASGRLAMIERPLAKGPFKEKFETAIAGEHI